MSSALLNELEERGLITRRRAPADRRRHIVELSGAGHAELAAAYARLSVIEDDLLGALSADERAILYRLLVRAVGAECGDFCRRRGCRWWRPSRIARPQKGASPATCVGAIQQSRPTYSARCGASRGKCLYSPPWKTSGRRSWSASRSWTASTMM
jgi:hypothetical protein